MRPDFSPMNKIPRLNRDIVVTEKIDGTNASILIQKENDGIKVYAGSRTRWVTPEQDNFGFAQWVAENEAMLAETLGEGHHFGEWWGRGIQKAYPSQKGKQFFLFNVNRWRDQPLPAGLGVVPVLYEGAFNQKAIEDCIERLKTEGSIVSPGDKAEGVVIYHKASNQLFKVTCEKDESPKGLENN